MAKGNRVLSVILALVVVTSLFAGITVAAGENTVEYSYLTASANSGIIHAGSGQKNELTATGTAVTDAESFQVITNQDGTVSFLSKSENSYVTPHDNGQTQLVTGKFNKPNDWSKFAMETQPDGTVAIKSVKTGRYVTVDLNNNAVLAADSKTIGQNEKFTIAPAKCPVAPSGLTVGQIRVDSVGISWTAVERASGYNVYRSLSSGGTYAKLNSSPLSGTGYTDSGLDATTTYYYKVAAVNVVGESALSEEIAATTLTPPTTPKDIVVSTFTMDSISLAWTLDSNSTGYNIYRSATSDGEYVKLNQDPLTVNSYTDSGLVSGTTYYYKVSGLNLAGESALSAEIPAITALLTPGGIRMISSTEGTITLSWPAAQGAAGYNVYRSATAAGSFDKINTDPVSGTSFTDTGLTAATAYYYKVSAVNVQEETAQSDFGFATTSGYGNLAYPYSYIISAANYKIIHADSNTMTALKAISSDAVTDSELFRIIYDNATGLSGIVSKSLNTLACADSWNTPDYKLLPRTAYSGQAPGGWEAFTIVPQGDGTVAIKANNGGKYVTVEPGTNILKATSSTVGINEKFIIVTPSAPVQPTGLAVAGKALYNSVSLKWTAPAASLFTGYNVYRSETSGGPYTRVNASPLASAGYTDTSVSAGTTYYYVVAAVNTRGETNSSEISVTTLNGPLPEVPAGLDIASAAGSANLSWTSVADAQSYNIYRSASRYGTYAKINTEPVTATNFTDSGSAGTSYYEVSAVNVNGESDLSAPMSLEIKLFGPNVFIFDPGDNAASVQETAMNVFSRQEYSQFGSERYALLFKPGTYNINFKVGFYTQVAGLGQLPDDVTINGGMTVDAAWMGGNATCNFWRSAENLSVLPASGTTMWGVSQAAPLRRVHIKGKLTLADSGWSSGGFLADSKVDGQISSGSQQQWFTRNTTMGSWTGQNWNMVFVGTAGGPAGTWPATKYTTVANTPVVSEKPFLTFDAATGSYSVFVPGIRNNSNGISWANGIGQGQSIPLDQFFVAKPGDSASSMNAALSEGKNLLFTPGIYHLSETIHITRADTVVLGLGLASLIPDNGIVAMKIDDVDGVKVAGIIFDAGPAESPMMLQVGPEGSTADHSADPAVLSDVFFRIGGAGLAKSVIGLEINSSNVIGDDFWVWRADHGEGSGWDSNTSRNGMIVNGNNVTIYALMVEHFQEYQTIWNGNGGRTYFYQSEIPYDIPSQDVWMSHDGTVNGFASYKVADTVTTHETWGFGIYSFFRDAAVKLNSAMEVPNAPGVKVHNACTVWLSGMAGSEITHVVNNTGDAVTYSPQRQEVDEYCNNVDQPAITPKTGTYLGAQTVTITCPVSGASIRYTTDGSTPAAASGTLYTGPFAVSALGSTTIKAIAFKDGMNDSPIATSTVTITDNVAYKKAASASSSTGANTPDKAFDGDSTTRWESAQSDPQSLTVDLGQSYNVTGVKIVWEGASASDYTIDISNDGTNWTTAWTVTNAASGAGLEAYFPAVAGRFVRMNGTARAVVWWDGSTPMRYGYSIYEFEVYDNKVAAPVITPATGSYTGSQTVTITDATESAVIRYTTDGSTPSATNGLDYTGPFTLQAVGTKTTVIKAVAIKAGMNDSRIASSSITVTDNLVLNKPVIAYSSQQAGNEANKINDGSLTTRWCSNTAGYSPAPFVTIDMGSVYKVGRIEVAPYSNRPYKYKVEVSVDGTNFTQVVDRTGNTTGAALLTDTFAQVDARYVRITVTGCSASTWGTLYEVRAFEH